MIRIEELTRDHLIDWFGDEGRNSTAKGVAGYVDDQLVAVAGFRIIRGHVVAFCDLKEEARPHKLAIALVAERLIRDAKKRHRRLLAVRDENEPTSGRWLTKLGFKPTDENGVWEWRA